LINKIPHDPDAWLYWITKHGVRLTGMPGWEGMMTDDEMWQTIAFIKHSNKLPADVESGWRKLAVGPETSAPVPAPAPVAPAAKRPAAAKR
jgi:hypothetical protein